MADEIKENVISDEKPNQKKKMNPVVEKTIKGILITLIIVIVGTVAYSFLVKDALKQEADNVILQINRAEDLFYSMSGKYHYFTKTQYDATLGVEVANNRFFTSYQVQQSNNEDSPYEVNLYGRTNAFAIVWHDLTKKLFK